MEISAAEQQEMLDLKKIEGYNELFVRLQRELQLHASFATALALEKSVTYLEDQGLGDKAKRAGDNGKEPTTQPELRASCGKVLQALRQSLYGCTQKIKRLDDLGRKLDAELKAELAELSDRANQQFPQIMPGAMPPPAFDPFAGGRTPQVQLPTMGRNWGGGPQPANGAPTMGGGTQGIRFPDIIRQMRGMSPGMGGGGLA
jgi:hypothetical protein